MPKGYASINILSCESTIDAVDNISYASCRYIQLKILQFNDQGTFICMNHKIQRFVKTFFTEDQKKTTRVSCFVCHRAMCQMHKVIKYLDFFIIYFYMIYVLFLVIYVQFL